MDKPVTMDTIVSLAKRRGFVFPSSEIYGGFGSTWDYGPLGVELKRNIKNAWWRANVQERDDVVGLDTAILMAPGGLGGVGPPRQLHRPAGGLQASARCASAPTRSRARAAPTAAAN